MNSNLPEGAEYDPKAPWNQPNLPSKTIPVTVSVTLSRTLNIKVADYTIKEKGVDEDGYYWEDIDYSDCDLVSAVSKQHILPQTLCTAWTVDEFEVIPEVLEKIAFK